MAEPQTKSVIHKLKQSRLHMGEARLRWWFAEIEEGTPYESLFEPAYWDVHGYKFGIGDFIHAEPDEGHYTAQLRIVSAGAGGIRVQEFYKKDWKKVEAPASLTDRYRVKFAGPHHKWRIERLADGHVEQAGFPSEAAANIWLGENLRALTVAQTKRQSDADKAA